jgi:hypothetical protein
MSDWVSSELVSEANDDDRLKVTLPPLWRARLTGVPWTDAA